MLSIRLNLAPRLRMSGAEPLLPMYAFTAYMGQLYSCQIHKFFSFFADHSQFPSSYTNNSGMQTDRFVFS
jgi:hypothetical protein